MKTLYNLGIFAAFSLFLANVLVFVAEERISRTTRDCKVQNGTLTCGKEPTIDHKRNGINIHKLNLCADLYGMDGYTTTPDESGLETAILACAQETGNDQIKKCNEDHFFDVFQQNPFNAFSASTLLDFNIYDMCDAPAYLGGESEIHLKNDFVCEKSHNSASSGALCALQMRFNNLGIASIALGSLWGLLVILAFIFQYFDMLPTMRKVILSEFGENDNFRGVARAFSIFWHFLSFGTIILMSYYVLSALNWGLRMNNCDAPYPETPKPSYTSALGKDGTNYIGDDTSPSDTQKMFFVDNYDNKTMVSFRDIYMDIIADKSKVAFIPWTEIPFGEHKIPKLRNASDSEDTGKLCPGGVGAQLNANPGKLYKDSVGIDGKDFMNILISAFFFVFLPVLVGGALNVFSMSNKDDEPESNPMFFYGFRLVISLALTGYVLYLAITMFSHDEEEDRCGANYKHDVATLGTSSGDGQYYHGTIAQVFLYILAFIALYSSVYSFLMMIGTKEGSYAGKFRKSLNGPNVKMFMGVLLILSLVVLTVVFGAIIGENATDVCKPMLTKTGVDNVTASLFILFGIIVLFAGLFFYHGAMGQGKTEGGMQSMSYFKLSPISTITESFI